MGNNKLFSTILIALLGLSAVLSILFFADVVSEGLLITWCYLLLAIAAVTAVVFPIITMAQNPKGAKNALIGVVGLVVVVGISYAVAGSKQSETGLIAFYIMGAGAIGAVIFAEVSKMLK